MGCPPPHPLRRMCLAVWLLSSLNPLPSPGLPSAHPQAHHTQTVMRPMQSPCAHIQSTGRCQFAIECADHWRTMWDCERGSKSLVGPEIQVPKATPDHGAASKKQVWPPILALPLRLSSPS